MTESLFGRFFKGVSALMEVLDRYFGLFAPEADDPS